MDSHKFLCSLGNLLLKDDVLWVIYCLKERCHEAAAENGYVVTVRHSREIHDVTNGDVQIRSEMAKHRSRRTVVKLTTAYFMLETDS